MKHWFVFFLALSFGWFCQRTANNYAKQWKHGSRCLLSNLLQEQSKVLMMATSSHTLFDKATVIDDPLYKGSIMWKVAGFGEEDTPQKPALPYRLDSFTVPDGYSVNVKVVDSLFVETSIYFVTSSPSIDG